MVPALRQSRPRLILGGAAVAGAASLAAYAALAAARLGLLLALVGAAAAVVLATGLSLRATGLATSALVLLGGEYAGFFAVRGGTVDPRAPLYGAGFLVVAELAFAALELRAGTPEPGLVERRAAVLLGLALATIAAGTAVIAAAALPLDGGVVLTAVGVLASVALLLALGRLAVRSR